MSIDPRSIRANFKIRAPQIRLIAADGRQVGIVTVKEGIQLAQEEGLDLVEISPNTEPPVCRILDLGKYIYTLNKKEKESKKKQKTIDIKEVKVTFKIGEHDYQTKLRNARRFLERGDKVKLTMFFRGREISHSHLGQKVIDRFTEDVSDIGFIEKREGFDGRSFHLLYAPGSPSKKPTSTKGNDDENQNENQQSSAKTV
ncbi:MAG: translation initiation factor IF-3 [Candidatus Omnitrophota bacterium]